MKNALSTFSSTLFNLISLNGKVKKLNAVQSDSTHFGIKHVDRSCSLFERDICTNMLVCVALGCLFMLKHDQYSGL